MPHRALPVLSLLRPVSLCFGIIRLSMRQRNRAPFAPVSKRYATSAGNPERAGAAEATAVINLQRFQERDQGLPVVRGELQPEFVTFDRAGTEVETLRHIIVFQSRRIEPFF